MRYSFSNCVLETESYSLSRDGELVAVEPQVFDLLQLLAENAGKLVTKDTLIEVVWDGRIVSEATVSTRINAARTAVGDNGKNQAIIKTVARRGFEMVAPVSLSERDAASIPRENRQTIRFATSADGTQIAYAECGDGPKLLRAGHFLTHLEMDWVNPIWRPYIDAMSADHTLIRYDQRGTGLSQWEVDDLDIDAYVADLLAVADAAGLERFPLVASSQGVPISIKFAATYPDRVSHLVLYGGFAQGRTRRPDQQSEDEAGAMVTMIRSGWGKPESAFMVAFTSIFCPGASKEELDSLIEIQLASAAPAFAVRIRQAIDKMDVTEDLAKVQAPTLVIHASNDALNAVSQGRLVAAGIPGAEYHQVDSNNHMPLPSDPAWQEIVAAQLEFINFR
jgi:DNA-binding winged helix-turn-helix (wHTH) protein/alpha-beta hydrolase superfamily lysophospholipase